MPSDLSPDPARPARPLLIAHRGASGHAPEHTLASYRLAMEQGADYVEQDLQMSRDGVLVCLHDPDLSRTTDVEQVFADRRARYEIDGRAHAGWAVADFTLSELGRLDAGSWFNRAHPFAAREEYAGQRIPTLKETIRAVGDRAGLYIETKEVEFYAARGLDMVGALVSLLAAEGVRPESVFIQSFSRASLIRLRELDARWRRIQLLPVKETAGEGGELTARDAAAIAAYADGVGPDKRDLTPELVALFQEQGLQVHPYTFRGTTTASRRAPLEGRIESGATLRSFILGEITTYLEMGIDGGFTDYPDLWREAVDAWLK